MKCFVVSLKNSGRRKDFDHRFKIFNYQFFDAITELAQVINSTQLLQNQYSCFHGRCLRKGEIGCSLSHFNIINEILH
ncbi:glycosyltransferase family 25 protein [Escherichia coli]|uniref:glycosyltransferase family 25 protein n=1 Tax=Escherichia coli TaxID=562 RepID=UPI0039865C2C